VAHANARLTPAGRLILVQRIATGRPAAHVADQMGISRTTAYRWWHRWQAHGMAGLQDRPSVAHHHPRRTPPTLEAAVLALRTTRKLGPARIAPLVGLPASTVYRVLRRHQLHRLAWMDRPSGRLIRRYERAQPGELVHVDVKQLAGCAMVAAIVFMAATRPSTAPATATAGGVAAPATTTSTPPSTTTPGWLRRGSGR
jgi:transposase-like protein